MFDISWGHMTNRCVIGKDVDKWPDDVVSYVGYKNKTMCN